MCLASRVNPAGVSKYSHNGVDALSESRKGAKCYTLLQKMLRFKCLIINTVSLVAVSQRRPVWPPEIAYLEENFTTKITKIMKF